MPYYYEDRNEEENSRRYDKLQREARERGERMSPSALREAMLPPDFGPVTYVSIDEYKGVQDPIAFADPFTGRLLHKVLKELNQFDWRRDRHNVKLLEEFIVMSWALGVRFVNCNYNGGYDEGFASINYIEMSDGRRYTSADFVMTVMDGPLRRRLADKLTFQSPRYSTEEQLIELMQHELPLDFVSILLLSGYGTNVPMFYGVAIVDMRNCTIEDDRDATPPWASDAAP